MNIFFKKRESVLIDGPRDGETLRTSAAGIFSEGGVYVCTSRRDRSGLIIYQYEPTNLGNPQSNL